MTANLSAEARAVVRAFDGLTTQVRRIADALTTPVVRYEVAADDDATTAYDAHRTPCDASIIGALGRPLGPCVLIHGHDGPVHRGPDGETWWDAADDAPTTPATTCSAQHTGLPGDYRECIRAAQHRGDHIDERGFHWSDTVAVYPIADGVLKMSVPIPRPVEVTEDERLMDAAALYRQGLISDSEVNAVFATTDEDAQRTERRARLLNLLARLQRGGMRAEESVALRQHVEAEMREADTAREQARKAREGTALDMGRDLLRDGLDAFLMRLVGSGNTARILGERDRARNAIERVQRLADEHPAGIDTALILAALDGAEQPTPKLPRLGTNPGPPTAADASLPAKLDEATATLRRIRAVTRSWEQRALPRSQAHQLLGEVRDALAGPRPDPQPEESQ